MTLLTKEVEVKWHGSNQKHYEALGYVYTKRGDSFKIPVEHLPNGSNLKIKVRCDYCEEVCSPSWQHFLKGRRRIKKDACGNSTCRAMKKAETRQGYYTTVADIPKLLEEWDDEADPVKVLAYSNIKCRWKCKTCSKTWISTPKNRSKGKGCPHCANYFRYTEPLSVTHSELITEWSDKNELSPDEVTAGSEKKISWECSTCGHEWIAYPKDRSKGKGCPACNESKGEKKVAEILRNLDVDFTREYSFIRGRLKGVSGGYLRYDFALYLNGELFGLIEVDGEFHRRNVYGTYEGERAFLTQQEHDRRKDLFAEVYDIPLFRIKYESRTFSERDLSDLKEFVNGWREFEKTVRAVS